MRHGQTYLHTEKFILFIFFIVSVSFLPALELFSDGTDFSLAMATLGISHPPSYPVQVLLSSFFKYMPIGNMAFKVNLFSNLTAVIFMWMLWKLYDGEIEDKLCLSFLIFFSATYFQNMHNGEVYILNLICCYSIYFFYDKFDDIRYFYTSAFIFGLGLAVHHTIIFIAVFIIIISIVEKRRISLKHLLGGIFFILLGFSVYLYMPLRALANPLWNWGNPKNLFLFLNSLLRHDFQGELEPRDLPTIMDQVISFNPFSEFGSFVGIAILFGLLLVALKKPKTFMRMSMFVAVFFLGTIIVLGNDRLSSFERSEVYSVFFLPAYVMLVMLFIEAIKDLKNKKNKLLIILIVLFFSLYNFTQKITKMFDYAYVTFPHDYARTTLAMLPRKNSVLIVQGGEKDFPIFYNQKICKFREDVKVISLAFLGKIWNLQDSLKDGVAFNVGAIGEKDEKLAIIKSVILFQKEVSGKRVFTNVYDKDALPSSIRWQQNGFFQEAFNGEKLNLSLIRGRSIPGGKGFIENILFLNSYK